MDKNFIEYRQKHRRCRNCKYFTSRTYGLDERSFFICKLKNKFLKDRLFLDSVQGYFCHWYKMEGVNGPNEV